MVSKHNRIKAIVRKEFRHIFRDKVSCLLLFLMPAAILLIFGYAMSFDTHHINIQVYNPGQLPEAERLFARLDANPRIRVVGRIDHPGEIDRAFARHNTRAVIVYRNGLDVFLDASSLLLSSTVEALLFPVIRDFIADEYRYSVPEGIPDVRYLYNPPLQKEFTPIPGLAMIVFILVSSIVLGTSVNKEKVQGTFRLLMLTRLSSLELVTGKTLPYLFISIFQILAVYLTCLHFAIPVRGSLALFFGLCLLYSLCCMSLGLLIAAWFDRPLDVLILSWSLLFVPNVALSGFVFPLGSMTGLIRDVAGVLPGTAFLEAFRGIAFKGTGLVENAPHFALLSGECLLASALAVLGLTKRNPR